MKRNAVYGLLLFFLLIISLAAQNVSADGGIFVDFGEHVHLPSQKAAIFWDGTNETMVISTKINSSNLSNMAWVTPVQSSEIPNVSEGNAEIFNDIAYSFGEYTGGGLYYSNPIFFILFIFFIIGIIFLICIFFLKKIRLSYFFIILLILIICASFSLFIYIYSSGMMAGSSYDGVEIIEMKNVDFYDVAILKATNATNLVSWLEDNDFIVPEDSIPVLQGYCDQDNCYFIVNKIDLNNSIEIASALYQNTIGQLEEIRQLNENLTSKYNIHFYNNSYYQDFFYNFPKKSIFYLAREIICNTDYENLEKDNQLSLRLINVSEIDYNNFRIDYSINDSYEKQIAEHYIYEWYNHKYGDRMDFLFNNLHLELEDDEYQDYKIINEDAEYENSYICIYLDDTYPFNDTVSVLEKIAFNMQDLYNELYEKTQTSIKFELCMRLYKLDKNITDEIRNFSMINYIINPNLNNLMNDSYFYDEIFGCIEKRDKQIKEDLDEGLATPLEIIFHPDVPMYPMKMSSINEGSTKINVYFISDYFVSDSSGLLINKGESSLSWAPFISDYDVGYYVTWMTFEGDTKDLIADSYFVKTE